MNFWWWLLIGLGLASVVSLLSHEGTLFGRRGTRCDYGPCRHCTDGWMTPEQAAAKERYEEFWRSGRFAAGDVTLEQLDRGDWS